MINNYKSSTVGDLERERIGKLIEGANSERKRIEELIKETEQLERDNNKCEQLPIDDSERKRIEVKIAQIEEEITSLFREDTKTIFTKSFAKLLDGRHMSEEISSKEEKWAKVNGLVVVFGSSDDVVEFRGFIQDELNCYGQETFYLGCLDSGFVVLDETPPWGVRDFKTIEATRNCGDGPLWSFGTTVKHEKFKIYSGEDTFCDGIVFHIDEVS